MDRVELTANEWTIIAESVSSITFQNPTQWPVYIGFSTDGNTVPTDDIGLIYPMYNGEVNIPISDLTSLASADCVWAKPVSGKDTFIHVEA